jgi:RNA polymerase-binding transcription factor DksA
VTDSLERERAEAQSQVAARQAELAELMAASQLVSTDDEHDPDGATIAFERARLTALLEQAERHRDRLDRAIRRAADGGYGECVRCGRDIAPERLAALPGVETCIDCAQRRRRASAAR